MVDEGFKRSEQLSIIKFKRKCVTIQLPRRAFAGMHRWDKSFYWETHKTTCVTNWPDQYSHKEK